jgi:DNA-binding NarL/FixJ family response regulator
MKILIADDHRIVRDGLQATLERAGHVVVGGAATGHEALALAHRLQPDVVTMDVSMPELNGIEATRRLTVDLPGVRVLALSMKCDRHTVMAMFAAGASGYLQKSSTSADELLRALAVVGAGQKYVSPAVTDQVLGHLCEGIRERNGGQHREAPKRHKPLSARERDVLKLLADGMSSKEIAIQLGLAVPTVETHRRQVMNKLGLHSVAELTKYAVREGLSAL